MSDLKIAYIAGPYRADTIAGVRRNIETAREMAEHVWRIEGWGAICPHLNTALMDGLVPDRKFLEVDLEILRRCDAVILAGVWWHSVGVLQECREANRLKLPIYDGLRDFGLKCLGIKEIEYAAATLAEKGERNV